MKTFTITIIVPMVAGMLWASSAPAQITSGEQQCMTGTSKALAQLVGAREKCVAKCWSDQRRGRVPASDCTPPYGGATAECLSGDLRGADQKAIKQIGKVCKVGCPACYSGGDCAAEGTSRVTEFTSALDTYFVYLWCDDSGSADGLTAGEAKCQDAAGKTFAKAMKAMGKCIDRCEQAVFKGMVPPGACAFNLGQNDTEFSRCTQVAWLKAVVAMNTACPDPAQQPECTPTSPLLFFAAYGPTVLLPNESAITYCE